MLFAAEASTSPVWHFWIAVPLAIGAIAVLIALVVGYFGKVTSSRYDKGDS